jgi:tetratricopeptide (TPR) repeat protein
MRTRAWLIGCSSLLLGVAALAQPRNPDQWYAAGQAAMQRGQYAAAEQAFSRAVQGNPSAANWRWLGEARVRLADYDGATQAFGTAILKYRALGDQLTANALENRTAPYRQAGEVYLLGARPEAPETLARLEPNAGLLMGAYVAENGITRDNRIAMRDQLGTGLAVYFRYHNLIRPQDATTERPFFPTRLALAAQRDGAALHLALEPASGLARVTPEVVEAFARAVRDARIPVFVRFASEFNDPANPWGRDPRLFIEKFRLVADTLHRVARNAATVWMPMGSRFEVLDRYYPGARYVDWAGISLYSTPFANGDRNASNARVSPLDAVERFYMKYSARHPIQISEYAASHETLATPGADYTRFATQKMAMLYWGAMLKFPRLKNINWLDVDMIRSKYLPPARALERRNNYALLGNPAKLEVFKTVLSDPYFLRDPASTALSAPVPLPKLLPAGESSLEIAAWVKTFDPDVARVRYALNGATFASSNALPYRARLPALKRGTHTLTLTAFNSSGKLLLTRTMKLEVR